MRYVWLSDEYSVPEDQLCLHEAQAPNRDFRCVRAIGHAGKHERRWGLDYRDYSHKDRPK